MNLDNLYPGTPIHKVRAAAQAPENWNSLLALEKILKWCLSRKSREDILEFEIAIGRRMEFLQHQKRIREKTEKDTKRQEYLAQGWFPWPSTFAPKGAGAGELDCRGWYKKGLFSYVGYHVGDSGETLAVRQRFLDCIFHNDDLPLVNDDAYMARFDSPKTPLRLQTMANFLAAEARNFTRNYWGDYSRAIADWKKDLDYLYDEYYVKHFNFDWPTIDANDGREPD